jgi:hypothetical protein
VLKETGSTARLRRVAGSSLVRTGLPYAASPEIEGPAFILIGPKETRSHGARCRPWKLRLEEEPGGDGLGRRTVSG